MKKRIFSLLLALVLVLGILPGGFGMAQEITVQATQSGSDVIKIDFKGLAEEIAEESWWQDLPMGRKADADAISDESKAQYSALLEYLAENKDWTINETASQISNTSGRARMLFLNTEPEWDWGMRYYANWLGDNEAILARNGLQIDLTVSAEDAGWYAMSVDAFKESLSSTQLPQGIDAGSGYCMIKVNGEVAMAQQPLEGGDVVTTINAGFVELKEGVNTVTIHNTRDRGGNLGHSRRTICLNDITFQKAEVHDGVLESLKLDFKAFAKKISTQDWWNDMIDSGKDDVKILGSSSRTVSMTAEQSAAYGQMLSFLAENEAWTISESETLIGTADACKLVLFDNSINDCGIRFWPAWMQGQNKNTKYSQLTFEVQIPLGAAGEYELLVDAIHESNISTIAQILNVDPGSGYYDIYVNGEEVVNRYDFGSRLGKNYRSNDSFGTVYLEEGINTITFDLVNDFNGNTNNRRRSLSLCGIELRGVDARTDEGTVYDFAKAAEITAEDGFAAIEDYADLNVDDVVSAPWHFAGKSGTAKYDTEAGNAMLSGEYVQFVLDVTDSGWLKPVLDLYKHADGGKVTVHLAPVGEDATDDAWLIGNVDTFGPGSKAVSEKLRPVYLTEGEYILTLTQSGTALRWDALRLKAMEEPELELYVGSMEEKPNRKVQLPVYGLWNGTNAETLTGAQWDVTVSDTEGVKAAVVPATAKNTAILEVTGLQPGTYTVTVAATVGDVTGEVTAPVKIKEPAALVSMDVTVPGVETVVARRTVQEFVYDMVGTDGEAILPAEVNIVYETDVDGIIAIDEENHTFETLQNGDVTVTITASVGDTVRTDTVELTVADAGENCFIYTDPTFEAENTATAWMLTSPEKYPNAYCWSEITDDGTGNHALKVQLNSEVSRTGAAAVGEEVRVNNGYFAKLRGGHMYEITAKVKVDGYRKSPYASGELFAAFQMYDYTSNARNTSATLDQVLVSQNLNLNASGWTEAHFVVRAPVTHEGDIYIMPRMVIRPNVGTDFEVSGWELAVWYDDFSIREVGFEGMDLELQGNLKDTVTAADILVKPYTTTGDYIDVAANQIANVLSLTSTNDDVVIVVSDPVRTRYTSTGMEYFPKASVKLVGLNAPAELVAKLNIHGIEIEERMDLSQSDMADVLRDISYTLDGFESAVLKNGEVAEGILTGRTTQLAPLNEEQLREGSVYFVSSDTKVATVDQASGDVTCVGEGTATITVYVLSDGVTASDSVTLTVTDDTDLAAVEVSAAVDYVGVNNTVQLYVSGTKASGANADMSKYPVAWSIDDEALTNGIASIDRKGRLTGLKPGTVTVTATVGVQRVAVSDSITVEVIPNTDLPGADVILDFTDSHLRYIHQCTLEKDGVQINLDKTYNGGKDAKTIGKYGFGFNAPVGQGLYFDFIVPRDGWYRVEAGGGLYSAGNICDIFLDEIYAGTIDFFQNRSGAPYSALCIGNTFYLEAGKHTFSCVSVTSGYQYLGKLILRATGDPNPITVTVEPEKDAILVGETMEVIVTAADANGKNFSLKSVSEQPRYDNYYMLQPMGNQVSASGSTLTGTKAGSAMVDVEINVNGKIDYYILEFTVDSGTIAEAVLTGERTTLTPSGGTQQLEVVCYDITGEEMEMPEGTTVRYESSDDTIASIDENGVVTAGAVEGSALITATITEGDHEVIAQVWFTITSGKTEPTIYTYEERTNAQENAMK